MTLAHRGRSLVLMLAAVSLAFLVSPITARADQPEEKPSAAKSADLDVPKDQADANPAAKDGPATAKVSPEARKLIEQVDAAYRKLKSLELAGTYSEDVSSAGDLHSEVKKFTASYVAPNKFRHAMEDDMLIGSNGSKAYAYLERRNFYTQADAPKEKAELAKLPEPMPQLMQMQNPSLMLAVVKSPAAELAEGATEIKKVDDVRLDGASFPALEMSLPNGMVVTMLFQPETHLLRQARTDIKGLLEQKGTPDVNRAAFTVDYTTVKPDAAVKEEQFAWTPPQAARDVAEFKEVAVASPAEGDDDTTTLEGKAAPAFKLKDMEGKEVALSGLKGKVVVIDFWATWCGPCRASLPHLDKLYASVKDKGVVFYAVNLKEEKEEVQNFIKDTGLKVPVLFDSDGSISVAYKTPGIPVTVVIGKDGKVVKAVIGFDPDKGEKEVEDAVTAAMK